RDPVSRALFGIHGRELRWSGAPLWSLGPSPRSAEGLWARQAPRRRRYPLWWGFGDGDAGRLRDGRCHSSRGTPRGTEPADPDDPSRKPSYGWSRATEGSTRATDPRLRTLRRI